MYRWVKKTIHLIFNMIYEMKLEFNDNESLNKLIEKTYDNGKLSNKEKHHLIVDENSSLFIALRDLDGFTVRLTNELINGSIRCMISEDKEEKNIKLYPCNIYLIDENGKYSFY